MRNITNTPGFSSRTLFNEKTHKVIEAYKNKLSDHGPSLKAHTFIDPFSTYFFQYEEIGY